MGVLDMGLMSSSGSIEAENGVDRCALLIVKWLWYE